MMNIHQTPFLALFLALVIPASSVSARPVKIWSFEELNEKADLVIVGTAISSADAKGLAYPEAKADTWVSVDTVFQIDSTLKGDLKTDKVTVRHNRYYGNTPEITIIDGPSSFIEFNTKLKNQYLIFLKRTDDGSYVPLTGQYDPGNSFFLLQQYHISKERVTSLDKEKSGAEQDVAPNHSQPPNQKKSSVRGSED
jgi:hypothetical protein